MQALCCASSHAHARRMRSRRGKGAAAALAFPPPPLADEEVLAWTPRASPRREQAPPHQRNMLILPGFGNAAEDYASGPVVDQVAVEGTDQRRVDACLAASLRRRGFHVAVLPVARSDWLKVVAALLSPNGFANCCTVHDGYRRARRRQALSRADPVARRWYLDLVHAAVGELTEATGQEVVLVGHSAGGWLARGYVGDELYGATATQPAPGVRAIVTLGSPHRSPPPGVFDVTRGCRTWLNDRTGGAHYPSIRYVSVAGRTVRGSCAPTATLSRPVRLASQSYAHLRGEAIEGVYGDGVVPLECALLPGSRQVLLDGVYHAMSSQQTYDQGGGKVWYGNDSVVDAWLGPLLLEELPVSLRTAR